MYCLIVTIQTLLTETDSAVSVVTELLDGAKEFSLLRMFSLALGPTPGLLLNKYWELIPWSLISQGTPNSVLRDNFTFFYYY
jgi:hypothetical protein